MHHVAFTLTQERWEVSLSENMSISELQQFHGVRRFELERSCCFSALLLDEERGRLFVGAKNFLLSLSLDNIAKQEHKVGQIVNRMDDMRARQSEAWSSWLAPLFQLPLGQIQATPQIIIIIRLPNTVPANLGSSPPTGIC